MPHLPRPPAKPTLRLNFGGLLRDLIAWQNTSGARAGLPPIPDVDGRQWPIAPRQFRRTLAREIAFRPHGTIASKIQLKHVHAHVTEGYWGPAGESAQRFIDELDREQHAASELRIRQRFDEWQQASRSPAAPSTGSGRSSTVIARELDSFTGTLDEREQRLRKLLRKRAQTLHFGVLNDCHFTDPSQARCLKNASTAARDAPLIAACQPARCANASIHHDHLPGWRGVIAHADELLERSSPQAQSPPPRARTDRTTTSRARRRHRPTAGRCLTTTTKPSAPL